MKKLEYCLQSIIYRSILIGFLLTNTTSILGQNIEYHQVRTDRNGNILPWYSENLGESYDHIIRLCFDFWHNMKTCPNGVKYYMQHMIWQPGDSHHRHGLGGDQLAMALSSWTLLHQYWGDPRILENMKYMADYYLEHSLSPSNAKWPNLPYPYDTELIREYMTAR